MSTPTDKDTIYIDIDDEITAIIDKVQASQGKIVALVLPKRATVLQSIVNMKLLKRAAASAHKNLVLITSEAGLLPLAGAAGVHVAKNLQSRPEIPAEPDLEPQEEEPAEDVPNEPAAEVDKSKSVGELATKSSTEKPKSKPEETVDVDSDDLGEKAVAGAAVAKAAKKKGKKDNKNKVPNFERFRKRLLIGGAVFIGILVFWFLAVFTLPKATITIKTDTSSQAATANFTASPSAQTATIDQGIIPAKAAESAKNDSQKAAATGSKDVGTKATGSVTITNCTDESVTIPGGTAVSSNGLNFMTNNTIQLEEGSFSSGGNCKTTGDHVGSVGVTAQNNGDQYNLGARSYSVSGQSGSVKAAGSDMAGGSSKVIKVVTQSDVDSAKEKLTSGDDAAKEQLKKTLQDDGYFAITETFKVKDEQTTITPKVGEEGSEVTVSNKGTYTMLGVKEDDLKAVIAHSVDQQIDADKQQVQDYGLSGATFKVDKTDNNGGDEISVNTQVAVGPKIDENQLKTEIAGKKRGDTENIIKALPGVKETDVDYSPFWVTKTPKKTSKITIKFEKAN